MPIDFINQNILLVAVVITSGLAMLWPLISRPAGNSANPAQATQLINREDAQVIDVREVDEYAAGHLPDAKSFPLSKLAERIGELESFKDKPLIVCCASGMRSGKACGELKKAGFLRLYNLAGGVDAWVGAGYPIKKGTRNK